MMLVQDAGAANDSNTPNINPKYKKYAYPAAVDARQRPDSMAAGHAPDLESGAYRKHEAGQIDHRRSFGHMRSFEDDGV